MVYCTIVSKMAKQVFESPDMVRMIYSFGEPGHREFTRTLEKELQCDAWGFDDTIMRIINESNVSILDILRKLSTESLETILYNFNRCFCCARHSNKKPMLSNKKFVITGPCVFENKKIECQCPCRSLSRAIMRELKCRYK